MNNATTMKSALAALLALLLPGAQAAWALDGVLDLGGRKVSVTGSEEKFNEYRDVRTGLFVDELELGFGGDAYYLEVEARDGGLRSERYSVEGGRYGKFKAGASYDRTPHNFSKGRFIYSGMGSDSLGLSSGLRTIMQTNEQTRGERGGVPTTDATGEDATQQRFMRDLISNTDAKVFSLERKKAAMALEFSPLRKMKTWLKASEERRTGARQMGTGSYERYAQNGAATNGDGGHLNDMFMVHGHAVAEPIDYKTTTLNLGAGYYDRKVSGDLEYTLTDFKDDLLGLTWANPFRNTDAAATAADDVTPNNANNRARFANGRLALPPSHRSHEVAASGSVELPLEGRLSAALGFGTVSQNADLLPITANSAIAGAGGGGGPADVTSVSALPTRRFDGKVNTLSHSLLLTARPAERLSARAKYRYYDYDNRSPVVNFTGYSAFGESYWRTVKNDKNAPVANEVVSYKRQTAELGADYDLLHSLSAGLETFWDRWAYENNRAEATSELGAGGSLKYHLGHDLTAHGKYRYSRRAVEGYRVGGMANNPEAVGLENFNWADRKRHLAQAGVSADLGKGVTLGLDGRYVDDTLGSQRFGLKGQETLGAGLEVAAAPSESFDIALSLGKEVRRTDMSNAAKDNAFNNTATSLDDSWVGDNFNPLNYWDTEIVDKTDTVALEAAYRPAEAWEFTGGYSFSYGRTSYFTTNPNEAAARAAGYAQGTKLGNAVAQAWPSVTSRLHELRVGGLYKLTKDVSFGLDYAFAKYMLNDFANVGEYVAGSEANENSTRFVLTGADKYDYTAHVVGARMSMRF